MWRKGAQLYVFAPMSLLPVLHCAYVNVLIKQLCFFPGLIDIIYHDWIFQHAKGPPESVLSVQCPFHIVLLITRLLKQCNVKRALARDFSQR